MKVSRLQTQAESAERTTTEAAEEVVAAKAMALSEYQLSVEFQQVCDDQYNEGVWAFLYNVWHKHPDWDLTFLGEATKEVIVEFNVPLETPLNDPPTEFVPPTD